MSTVVGTPEQCETLASGCDFRAAKHTADAERSLELAAEYRREAAEWRAKAEALRSRPTESTVAPSSPLGDAAADSAGPAEAEEPGR